MSIVPSIPGAALWFQSAWSSALKASKSKSLGPSVQEMMDQGRTLANLFASTSQDLTTGLAMIATRRAKKRVDAEIQAIKDAIAKEEAGSKVNKII